MTQDKIISILNTIRDNADVSYQNCVPVLTEKDLLSTYGAVIIGQPYVKNQFIAQFLNFYMYEETKQHIFESEFDRLKQPADRARYGSFEAFRNTIKPIEYDETKLDRILKLYKPDVKTAYFTRNRQDIFPMSITDVELEGAFQSYEAMGSFIEGLYAQLVNSNKVVEYNAIKECINVNANGGAIKTHAISGVNENTAKQIAKMIRSYATKMGKPSTEYNAYADMEGAVGNPVETSTPRKSLLLIADSDTIAEVSVEVLASAFNLPYADFQVNLIEVDDFGYNVYNRETQQVVGHTDSRIRFMLCDEAAFKIKDLLTVNATGMNDATLTRQTFYHIWQMIEMRPWANAVAFVEEADDSNILTIDNSIVRYNAPATLKSTDTLVSVDFDNVFVDSNGREYDIDEIEADELLNKFFGVLSSAFLSFEIVSEDSKEAVISRTSANAVTAGTYEVGGEDVTITEAEETEFYETYGDTCYVKFITSGADNTVFFVLGFVDTNALQIADSISSNAHITF